MVIKKEVKIALIMIGTLLIMFWGFNFMKGKSIFRATDDYYVLYKNVTGLMEANPVMVHGYKIGNVKSIEYDENNQNALRVCLAINRGVKIPINSSAQIINLNLMGAKGIELVYTTEKSYYVLGDTIPGFDEPPLLRQFEPFKNKFENMILDIDTLSKSLTAVLDKETIRNIKNSIKNIEASTYMIASEKENFSQSMKSIQSVLSNLEKNNKAITKALQNISTISDSIANSELKQAINNTNETLKSARLILDKINKGDGTLGKLINNDSLYYQLNSMTNTIDSLIIDLKKNPKNYVHFSVFGNKKK